MRFYIKWKDGSFEYTTDKKWIAYLFTNCNIDNLESITVVE